MPLSFKRRVVLEKVQAAIGAAEALAAADALLTTGLDINPIAGSYISRDLVSGGEGAQADIHTNRHARIETMVELTASGTAGTPPAYADMLLSCGFAETVTAATSVEYSLVSSNYQASTIRTHVGGTGGHSQTLVDCRGGLSFSAERGQVPKLTATRLGTYAAPVDAAPPAVDYAAFKKPATVEPAFMDAFTADGTKLCFRSFSFQDGRTPVVDKFANCPGVDISARNVTGSMLVEFPTLATKNMLVESLDGTLQPLVWRIGKTAGSIVEISAPKVQLKFTGYEDVENTLAGRFDLVFTEDAGDDDLKITYT